MRPNLEDKARPCLKKQTKKPTLCISPITAPLHIERTIFCVVALRLPHPWRRVPEGLAIPPTPPLPFPTQGLPPDALPREAGWRQEGAPQHRRLQDQGGPGVYNGELGLQRAEFHPTWGPDSVSRIPMSVCLPIPGLLPLSVMSSVQQGLPPALGLGSLNQLLGGLHQLLQCRSRPLF